jgi:predicted DNA-binding protein
MEMEKERKTKTMMLKLSLDMHASLMRFSKATGVPATRFVYEVLEQAREDLDRLSEVAETASKGTKATAAGVLMAALDSMGSQIDAMKNEVNDKAKSGSSDGKREAATPDVSGPKKAAKNG